ncbi:hypothetical protein I350_04133 [Cryptococcus amylolentus CBS 6273]|uniref:5'-3' exoribonuclease 1 n=1 Tax=Cryptococcus amylolentus CBS 6273 TaxID=1296118 RepID=A0A1E3K0X1_9TREE|nr:hypothetical protein I350_04133 [Cryptococcus amylolentus CBS 6273]
MGIPKFFRWISERYPLTSQLITPNSIPTFDNLYLDMNGIIHNCSHPPSSENDPHFRITEEQMIIAIFAYIDHLFTKIKPQKVFFMAIDGCAPRAKMNQQRSRRFRTARDAREQRLQAEKNGEKLPEEKAFDSNAITPGTPFMARLSEHLKYYVRKRISEDADWRNIKVIFSGHDVPGEGEHKIQEFIRLNKAQPDYNPNTRHCLYGLDADLIMLGLLSHDPHFCLLREEVVFGRKSKKNTELANANFFLLHISLLREYLNLEFSSLQHEIPFEYDLERIIDDFILMAIFVGNDFLPHLPDQHINEGALERIWGYYKELLPTIDGYLNEHGTISLPRLQLLLDKLAAYETKKFEEDLQGQVHYSGNHTKDTVAIEKARKKGKKGKTVITKYQKKVLDQIRTFVQQHQKKSTDTKRFALVDTKDQRDNAFIQEIGDELHLRVTWDEVDDYGQNMIALTFDMEGVSQNGSAKGGNDSEESETDEDDEGAQAIQRVFAKWNKAVIVDTYPEEVEQSMDVRLKEAMDNVKKTYYHDKLEISYENPADMYEIVHHYIEGLQWILNYYYKGVSSWGWFYKYHYSPRITDLKGIADMKFEFDYGQPFLPFQQLMGVLPADSQEHVPLAYRDLMYDPTSPILDFYPKDFELDMNGKKADWEAVVKIPFIDQNRLLKAMTARDHRLTPEERSRNQSGVLSTQFVFDGELEENYPSSLPGSFPELTRCHCKASPFNLPTLGNGVDLILGLLDGVHLGSSALAGFPSLNTIPHHGALGFHGVVVFQSESRNPSMVITITDKDERPKTTEIARATIGQRTYHNWPYLQEGLVVAVSDDMFKCEVQQMGHVAKIVQSPHHGADAVKWKRQADNVERHYGRRYGVITGPVEVLLHIRPLKGLKHLDNGALIKDYEGPEKEIVQAYQMAVSNVAFEDERFLEQGPPDLNVEYPPGEKVLFLGDVNNNYGCAAQVSKINDKTQTLDIILAYFEGEARDNLAFRDLATQRPSSKWWPSPTLSRRLGISALALSRITSTLLVQLEDGSKTNIGLPLKFESRGLKVLGFTKRNDRGWEYSEKAAQVLQEYKAAFPEVFAKIENRSGDLAKSRELCPSAEDPDGVIKAMKKWLKERDLVDFETVSLFADQLEKETCEAIEKLADQLYAHKAQSQQQIRKQLLRSVPRQSLLKPAQSIYRLQGQVFEVGHRVIMVQDPAAGGVPTGMRGVVVGLGAKSIDVIWDTPFMGGTTLQGRCSEYRGSSVPFSSCLNLTRRQFMVTEGSAPKPVSQSTFKPQFGPRPAVQGPNYQSSTVARQPPSTGNKTLFDPSSAVKPATARSGVAIVGSNGHLHYGNAAKGIKPEVEAQQHVSHRDQIANLLGGGLKLSQAPRPQFSHPASYAPAQGPGIHPPGNAFAHPPPAFANRGGPPARGRGRGRGGFNPAVNPASTHVHTPAAPLNGNVASQADGAGRGGARGRGGRGRGGFVRGRGRGGANGAANANGGQ